MGEIRNNFVFYSDWRDYIKSLGNEVDQYQLLSAIMDYGTVGEYNLDDANPLVVSAFETMIKPAIDRAQKNYADSIEFGRNHGRPKTIDDKKIISLYKKGMRARDIAQELGVSEAAVYHSEGWRNRKL